MTDNIVVTTHAELASLIEASVYNALHQSKFTHQKTEPRLSQFEGDYLNVHEAALYLKLAKSTVYQLVSKREIPFIKNGSRVIFSKTDLQEWVTKHKKYEKAKNA